MKYSPHSIQERYFIHLTRTLKDIVFVLGANAKSCQKWYFICIFESYIMDNYLTRRSAPIRWFYQTIDRMFNFPQPFYWPNVRLTDYLGLILSTSGQWCLCCSGSNPQKFSSKLWEICIAVLVIRCLIWWIWWQMYIRIIGIWKWRMYGSSLWRPWELVKCFFVELWAEMMMNELWFRDGLLPPFHEPRLTT